MSRFINAKKVSFLCRRTYFESFLSHLTTSMEQNTFWERNSSSYIKKFLRILRNSKVYYYTHNSAPPHPTVPCPQPDKSTSHLPTLSVSSILLLISHPLLSSKLSLSFRLLYQKRLCIYLIPHTYHMTLFDIITWKIFGRVVSTEDKTLIGRISDVVRSGRGSDFVFVEGVRECHGYAV